MKDIKYTAITGASGNLGSKMAHALLATGMPLKLAGRNRDKLTQFEEEAEVCIGDLEDLEVVKALMENTTSAFSVLPELSKTSIKDYAKSFIRIAENAGVSHIVNISNCTLSRWDRPTRHLEFETFLNETSSIHIKHLRCANFFENLNWGLHTPYRGDIKLPYISSDELVHIAANYLRTLSFTGISVDELMGAADYSMNDFAEKLGIIYKQTEVPDEDAPFFNAFNQGKYSLVKRNAKNTSKGAVEAFSLDYFLEHRLDKTLLLRTLPLSTAE
jgi:NAD(P)-dependent dehydrogenase (short-subunit alcohol dehydrogenase family)